MPTLDDPALVIRPPTADDAPAWVDFVLVGQAAAYDLPCSFAARERVALEAETSAAFAPGSDHRALLAEHDGRLVGVALTSPAPAGWEIEMGLVPPLAERELSKLYVDPAWHGTGLAARLFDAVMDDRPHYLWLIEGNERAGRFYERRGFVPLDERFETGDEWGGLGMHRMLREGAGPA